MEHTRILKQMSSLTKRLALVIHDFADLIDDFADFRESLSEPELEPDNFTCNGENCDCKRRIVCF